MAIRTDQVYDESAKIKEEPDRFYLTLSKEELQNIIGILVNFRGFSIEEALYMKNLHTKLTRMMNAAPDTTTTK